MTTAPVAAPDGLPRDGVGVLAAVLAAPLWLFEVWLGLWVLGLLGSHLPLVAPLPAATLIGPPVVSCLRRLPLWAAFLMASVVTPFAFWAAVLLDGAVT